MLLELLVILAYTEGTPEQLALFIPQAPASFLSSYKLLFP